MVDRYSSTITRRQSLRAAMKSSNATPLLLALVACLLPPVSGKTCIKNTGLELSRLYWSDQSYQGEHDLATFKLCMDSDESCEIKLHNGTTIGNKFHLASDTGFGEKLITINGDDDYVTYLYFTCEKGTLGVPVLLNSMDKHYYFEWRSLIACNGTIEDKEPQMPCYVYNDKQQLIDLTALTRLTNHTMHVGHSSIHINVCRNISGIAGCDGSVCNGSTTVSYIDTSTRLSASSDGAQLVYKKVDGGSETVINFRCPTSTRQATAPTLVSSTPYTIDWYTTHACPADTLKSKTCNLVSQQYGVNIDLSALSNNGETFLVSGGDFDYELGLCGTTVKNCDLDSSPHQRGDTVACQHNSGGLTKTNTSIGMSGFTELRYVEDVLTMKMSKGANCSSNYQRDTIIQFHCNQTGGIGSPEFVNETDCSYYFDWHTQYACDQSLTCVYTDPNNSTRTFDFSRLTTTGLSTSWTTEINSTTRAFINVCQPVGSISDCDPTAAVCIKKTGQDAGQDGILGGNNLGQASTRNFSKEQETITLSYSLGSVCNKTSGERHKTVIHFVCDPNDQSLAPQYRSESSVTCQHTFMWYTSAACASAGRSGNCSVTNKGYTYDFTSLAKNNNLELENFRINPCETLGNKSTCGADATVCNDTLLISKETPSLTVMNTHLITATYSNAIVRYNCDHKAENANITSAVATGGRVSVEVNTMLSCAPKVVDCRPSDSSGNVYDLSGLKGVNWEAGSLDGMKYFFSVCSPLDKSKDDVKQCKGSVSACQRTTGGDYVSLGYAASNPEVISTGNIRLHYINGARCHHGNGTPRETTVVLNCADVESRPTMTSEDGNCNYNIWFSTPKACPTSSSRPTTGTNCTLIKDGIKYDLSPLKSITRNVTQARPDGQSWTYYASVCNAVTSVPDVGDTCKTSGVCVKTPGGPFSGGDVAEMTMTTIAGDIEITYPDGAAGTKSIIHFSCSHTEENSLKIVSIVGQIAHFDWTTSLVCPPLESVNCSVFDNKSYDLSVLARHDRNYLAHKYSGELYYINVCHRLISNGGAAGCPPGSAACLFDSKTNKYTSLGRLSAKESVIGRLGNYTTLKYTNGDPCHVEGKNWSTFVLLKCNPTKTVVDFEPVGISEHEDCRQDFMLETSAACPVADTPSRHTVKCGQIDGFDTAPLTKQYSVDSEDHTYMLNFCGTDDGQVKMCGNATKFGVCQISKNSGHERVLAGVYSDTATRMGNKLTFNYTDGVKCAHDPAGSPRNVVLTLFCSQYAAADSQPQFVRESHGDCTYYIQWERVELCTTQSVPCTVVSDGHVISLEPLSDQPYYAVAMPDLDQYYQHKLYQLSVCKPLPISANNRCPGATVCESMLSDVEVHQDLGYVTDGPRVVNGNIELVYKTNTKCENDPTKTISSVIRFLCGDSKGAPYLQAADNCTYIFIWSTSEVCHVNNDLKPTSASDCKILHNPTGKTIDLSVFKGHTYKDDDIAITICSTIPSTDLGECTAGSAVCFKNKTSYGISSSMQLAVHDDDDVILQYDGGSSCRAGDEDSTYTTSINFVCDPKAGIGKPDHQITFERCIVRIVWKTSYVCVPDCLFDYKGHVYDFSHLTSQNHPITVPSKDYQFTINVCKNLPSSSGCGDYASVCAKTSDGQSHTLALTSTLTPHVNDDDRLTLTYLSDDEVICASVDQAPLPIVRIHLVPDISFGRPTYINSDRNNCTFDFEWKTYVANREDEIPVVTLNDGQFTDPLTHLSYSVKSALDRSVTITDGTFTYAVSLNEPLSAPELSPNCTDGKTHICQYEQSGKLKRAIGKNLLKSFYKDEELQLVFGSDSQCGRMPKYNSSTVINFVCSSNAATDSKPIYIDETASCRYIFQWEVSSLCKVAAVAGGSGGGDESHKLSSGVVAAIVITVLVTVAIVAVVVIYKIKRRRAWDGAYEYSSLNTDNDTTLLVSGNRGGGPRFYNDDDDDLII